MKAPILLTGVNGQVGGELLPLLEQFGTVLAPGRDELDLRDATAIRTMVEQVRPRWIVNPAAYTAVDKAESESELAYAINRDAVRAMGEAAAEVGAAVVHFSTDYVFPGGGEEPWREDDATGPLGVYGASKLAGEQALAATGAAHVILRTSWVYGARGKNFLLTILRAAREREELRIVADQVGAPTWACDLAGLTAHVMEHSEALATAGDKPLPEAMRGISGVYHACNAGETTWFGFAQEFLEHARAAEPKRPMARLEPISTACYPTPAKRPLNSRMSCAKLERVFRFRMPAWQQSTAAVMAEVAAR